MGNLTSFEKPDFPQELTEEIKKTQRQQLKVVNREYKDTYDHSTLKKTMKLVSHIKKPHILKHTRIPELSINPGIKRWFILDHSKKVAPWTVDEYINDKEFAKMYVNKIPPAPKMTNKKKKSRAFARRQRKMLQLAK